ncbi:hypothetical protein BV25DRAFT_831284 [Artomyces pyxidatus]|uniref:Uncharacterized protein n=1 Tax=Artomyces pyxidatus TaxID=48021 RepID=A0ACB8SD28_9AGAM|nr:hypothetical protein BV25DRAFT_831284 [Artomyces pyxidatus]
MATSVGPCLSHESTVARTAPFPSLCFLWCSSYPWPSQTDLYLLLVYTLNSSPPRDAGRVAAQITDSASIACRLRTPQKPFGHMSLVHSTKLP